MNTKRILACLLALVLCLSPLSALAEGEEPEDKESVSILVTDSSQNQPPQTIGNVTEGGIDIVTKGDASVDLTAGNVTSSEDYQNAIDAVAYGSSTITLTTGNVSNTNDREGARISAHDSSTIQATVKDVSSVADYADALAVLAYDDTTVTVNAGATEATGAGARALDAFADGDADLTVTVSGNAVSTESTGVNAFSSGSKQAQVTIEGKVTGGTTGLVAAATRGDLKTDVTGDVTGETKYGVGAEAHFGGNAEVSVGGQVSGGQDGVYVYSKNYADNEGSSVTVTVGQTDEDGAFTGAQVQGGQYGIYAEIEGKGQADIKAGDIEGGRFGIVAHASSGGKVDIDVGDIKAGSGQGVLITSVGENSQINVEAGDIETGDAGTNIRAGEGSKVVAEVGNITVTGGLNDAIEVVAGDSEGSGTVQMTAGDIISTQGGVEADAASDGSAEITVDSIQTGGSGVMAKGGEPEREHEFAELHFDAWSGQTSVTVNGDIQAGGSGVEAAGKGGGSATVEAKSSITADGAGVIAQGGNEQYSNGIYTYFPSAGTAEVTVAGDVAAGTTGVQAEARLGGSASVRVTGDVTGREDGVRFKTADEGTADVLVDGTIAGGSLGSVTLADGTEGDSVSLTAWKIKTSADGHVAEQLNESGQIVAAAHEDTASAVSVLEQSINYIIRTAAAIRVNGKDAGTLSAAKDGSGTALDKVADYEVAREGDKVYLNMAYDTSKYEVDKAYGNEEKTIEAEREENGSLFFRVLRGGGMFLSVLLKEKHVHTPGSAVKENEVPAQVGVAGSYDSVVYCTGCYQELERVKKTIDPLPEPEPEPEPEPARRTDAFTLFCQSLARRIRAAEKNETVTADASVWSGLQRVVFEALQDRPDVALTLTCTLNGSQTELTIPAGAGLLGQMGKAYVLTFDQIAELLG